jgi:rare lipoprotein A (peptidoglycan hydrolase)
MVKRGGEVNRLSTTGQGRVIYPGVPLRFLLCFFLFPTLAHAGELKASFYSRASLIREGTWKNGETRMANGERFDENKLTCATRLYKLGTFLTITNSNNGKTVVVKVTDRIGKRFAQTRIDLSQGAFVKIADLKSGIVPITVSQTNGGGNDFATKTHARLNDSGRVVKN